MSQIDLSTYEKHHSTGAIATVVVQTLSLYAGLDLAVNSVKEGQITKAARRGLTDLLREAYVGQSTLMARALLAEEVDGFDATKKVDIQIDLPDDVHSDLIVYYKFQE